MKENLTNLQERPRCAWVPKDHQLYEAYHDNEWGVAVHDDLKHFEFLILESAQAGLSWETILKRRLHYAEAFANFNWIEIAKFNQQKVENLMKNSGIIKNRLKIQAAINNAQRFMEVREEFGTFDTYVWQFVGGKTKNNYRKSIKEVPSETEESRALSKDLRRRNFKFVGPTIMYAYMQAVGMVNDHTQDCFCYVQES
ncbi:hypothetical protein DB41_IF00070 [Neochlamydia sp. TUME1]|uniref:DNA-3-methyladenine glycosylase I n=1 Tax=Neochlamydia sp. TUME1 TaxID=1478174 RepID=UPI00057E3218|nr:DNA-3-methyladenine glycosylase I [Neochlamydia sp. TUME1]KIC74760.1 hypothetical protein DB41_IF00070 [Neochlamydia sp. TUME1]